MGVGMYINEPLKTYLDDLAAKSPSPGGGSAAALAASVASGLMLMVANYTIGNPKYKDAEASAADIMVRVQQFNAELYDLIDEDVTAYRKLSQQMKDPKKDPARLDQAFKDALQPPFEVCKITSECLKLCHGLAKCGNKNLITDTAIAAIMLEGAFFSAKYNVYENLKSIKDMAFIEKVHGVLAPLEKSIPKLKEDVLELCEEVITK